MPKDILAIVEDAHNGAAFLGEVACYAQAQGAFLQVAALTPSPMVSPALVPVGAIYTPEAAMIRIDAENVAAVREHLETARCDAFEILGLHDDIAWLAGDLRRSRQIADLVIVGAKTDWTYPWLRARVLETLVRSAGTPIMVLPADTPVPPLRRVVLGWKPSPEATRAVHDLVSLAEPGAHIDVVTVDDNPDENLAAHERHAAVRRHLLRRGFQIDSHSLDGDHLSEANVLTRHARETDADAIVIGAVAHSRVRDILPGCVTRDLIKHAPLPVILSN